MNTINIGLDDAAREAAAKALNEVLADTYMLYVKTHAFHWNVTGKQFHTLHVMFEEQYQEMWAALDEIAERVRALGVFAPSSSKAFAKLAEIASEETEPPAAEQMLAILQSDHELLIRRARAALSIAGDSNDAASEDLLTVRIQTHEKTLWMLRAMSA